MSILTINAGSSSIKFALYPIHAKQIESALISGMVEGLQTGGEVLLPTDGVAGGGGLFWKNNDADDPYLR